MHRYRKPMHPFALPLLVLAVVAATGLFYWLFGIGRDAFTFFLAAFIVFSIPVVVIFLSGGVVLGIRRLLRGQMNRKDKKDLRSGD
jgi:drug/metabolite transporter (DMT)-like permease